MAMRVITDIGIIIKYFITRSVDVMLKREEYCSVGTVTEQQHQGRIPDESLL